MKGALTLGRPRWGRYALPEVQVTLSCFELFPLSNVPPDTLLVQAHRADAVPGRPEVQPRHPTLFHDLAVNPNRTLALPQDLRNR